MRLMAASDACEFKFLETLDENNNPFLKIDIICGEPGREKTWWSIWAKKRVHEAERASALTDDERTDLFGVDGQSP
jgi:hypothetical protein